MIVEDVFVGPSLDYIYDGYLEMIDYVNVGYCKCIA